MERLDGKGRWGKVRMKGRHEINELREILRVIYPNNDRITL